MPILCTYADLAALRDSDGKPGPMTKLNRLGDELPIVDAERVKSFIEILIKKTAEYERIHLRLLEHYGERDPENNLLFTIPPDRMAEYAREFERLGRTPCEITTPLLPVDTCEKLPLTAADLVVLEKFIEVLP